MGHIEQREVSSSRESLLPSLCDVFIVGAGLSGLALASQISSSVDVCIIDRRSKEACPKEAMYLVNQRNAERWNVSDIYRRRKRQGNLINGTVTYDASGNEIERRGGCAGTQYGFATVPQTEMEKSLRSQLEKRDVHFGVVLEHLEKSADGDIEVQTTGGKSNAHIVIDATGWDAGVMHEYYGDEDYFMRGLVGGNFRASGFNPQYLHFISGLPDNTGNWMMPISETGAEVIAGQDDYRSRMDEWWEQKGMRGLEDMQKIYKNQGKHIFLGHDPHKMAFRKDPAKRKFFKGRVIPFGEAAGHNSPLWGQLIDVLPSYAQRLSCIINDAKETGSWDSVGERFYDDFLKHPPFSYILHRLLQENRYRTPADESSANRYLFRALHGSFDEETLWRMLQENGLTSSEVVNLLAHKPVEMLSFILQSTPSLLSLLVANPELFLQFLYTTRENILRRVVSEKK